MSIEVTYLSEEVHIPVFIGKTRQTASVKATDHVLTDLTDQFVSTLVGVPISELPDFQRRQKRLSKVFEGDDAYEYTREED